MVRVAFDWSAVGCQRAISTRTCPNGWTKIFLLTCLFLLVLLFVFKFNRACVSFSLIHRETEYFKRMFILVLNGCGVSLAVTTSSTRHIEFTFCFSLSSVLSNFLAVACCFVVVRRIVVCKVSQSIACILTTLTIHLLMKTLPCPSGKMLNLQQLLMLR